MRTPAIDVHAHFFPEPYLKLIEQEGASFGASVDREKVLHGNAARVLGLR